ncbi:MAG: Metallophosphoesterase [Thermacetogenium phaeum]|jgi:hypothetical protein|uniref:Metallophosphoesterase n=1 Tax=Thermacetogenium phaeum TaxID=85874 RepID=A0A101FFJ7_9THEO|nr:MAG: Metallophosphoesterase [Thermacetogenium phaeum]
MLENVIHRLLQRRVMKPVIPGLVLFLLLGLAARSGGVVEERVAVPLPGLPAVGTVCHCFPTSAHLGQSASGRWLPD